MQPKFKTLVDFLNGIPGIEVMSQDDWPEGQPGWWVKLDIDIHSTYAWHIVQELGCVLNYLSINERLPTVFKPVSPTPYLNGGPSGFLSWVIECEVESFPPGTAMKWLKSRLPDPADELSSWEALED